MALVRTPVGGVGYNSPLRLRFSNLSRSTAASSYALFDDGLLELLAEHRRTIGDFRFGRGRIGDSRLVGQRPLRQDFVFPLLQEPELADLGRSLRLVVFFQKPLDAANARIQHAGRGIPLLEFHQRRRHRPGVHHCHVGPPLIELHFVAIVAGVLADEGKQPQIAERVAAHSS